MLAVCGKVQVTAGCLVEAASPSSFQDFTTRQESQFQEQKSA